jgi:hypothetical protein
MPEENVLGSQKLIFDTLVEFLTREDLDKALKGSVVDYLFSFISDPAHVELALSWLEKGYIYKAG